MDHKTKCVFNGSALGKTYSAKAVQERCQQGGLVEQKTTFHETKKQQVLQLQIIPQTEISPAIIQSKFSLGQTILIQDKGKALDALMQPEHTTNYVPYQLKKKHKKKKRKRISNDQ